MEYQHIVDCPLISIPDFAVIFPNLAYLLITHVCSVTNEAIALLQSRLPRLSYLSIEDCPSITYRSETELREIVGPRVRVNFRPWRLTTAAFIDAIYIQMVGDEEEGDY